MIEIILALLALLTPMDKPNQVQVGKATTFYPVEKGLNNGILGCTGEKWVDETLPYCASRKHSLCGQWVLVETYRVRWIGRAGSIKVPVKQAWCKVMDKGPWGKKDLDGVWFNAATDRKDAEAEGREPKCPECEYLAILDMGPTVAKQLESKGRIRVRVSYWKNNPLAPILDKQLLNK